MDPFRVCSPAEASLFPGAGPLTLRYSTVSLTVRKVLGAVQAFEEPVSAEHQRHCPQI